MTSGDEFARELFEDAKNSLHEAKNAENIVFKQRHLRHSLLSAFSFLELQIDLLSQHFKDSEFFTLHERGIVSQKEVAFDRGEFRIKDNVRFWRLADRMLLLQHKFAGSRLTERPWWTPLLLGTERRNSVAHPKGSVVLVQEEIEQDLGAVLNCADDLFKIVFSKGLPYAKLGLKPKLRS